MCAYVRACVRACVFVCVPLGIFCWKALWPVQAKGLLMFFLFLCLMVQPLCPQSILTSGGNTQHDFNQNLRCGVFHWHPLAWLATELCMLLNDTMTCPLIPYSLAVLKVLSFPTTIWHPKKRASPLSATTSHYGHVCCHVPSSLSSMWKDEIFLLWNERKNNFTAYVVLIPFTDASELGDPAQLYCIIHRPSCQESQRNSGFLKWTCLTSR